MKHTKEEVLAMADKHVWLLDAETASMLRAYAAMLGDGPVGWQPMETAPRDGTEVDLWFPNNGGFRITYCKWKNKVWREWRMDCFENMDWLTIKLEPTHWMPLPPAPQQENE